MRLTMFVFILLCLQAGSSKIFAQNSSYGPGKALPMQGMKSKYTYPQPAKKTPTGPERIEPASEVPDEAEKFIWKLKVNGAAQEGGGGEVPVYYFATSEAPVAVGTTPAGEEIKLEEFRVVGRRNFYKFNWQGSPNSAAPIGKDAEFFVDGMNVTFAGKR